MKKQVKTILIYSITTILVLVMIGFSGVKRSARPVNDVAVEIITLDGNYFTDRQQVIKSLNADNTDYVLNANLGDLDLKMLESRIEQNPFVKKAEVYKDLKGNLMVKVKQVKPVARIYNRKGGDYYIDNEGYMLPITARQTARVPIIELEHRFSWKENITETTYGQQLLELLLYIEKDKFWKAQIAELVIGKDGEIVMLPQVTKQEITFGMPEEIEEKFKKLALFYKEILPNKGWNTYSMVNLKFKKQIVCE